MQGLLFSVANSQCSNWKLFPALNSLCIATQLSTRSKGSFQSLGVGRLEKVCRLSASICSREFLVSSSLCSRRIVRCHRTNNK